MSDSIKSTLTKLLQGVDISPDKLVYSNVKTADVMMTFTVNWFFKVSSEDTVLRSVGTTDTIVDEDALKEFYRFNISSLTEDKDAKRPFCTGLENKTPREVFDIGNKVNRISQRHAKGNCKCPDCHGSKKVNCPNCSGYGLILCPSCQGREGGCSRCKKTGYIECPTCHRQQKIPCQKCRGTGHTLVDRQIFLQANSYPFIDVELINKEDCFNVPKPHIDYACYRMLLTSLPFKIFDAEFKEDGVFKLTFKAKTKLEYMHFNIVGISKTFHFFTSGFDHTPLNKPKVLDSVYYMLKTELANAAVGHTLTDMDTKMGLFKTMITNKSFYTLLRNYENVFDSVTHKLQVEVNKTDQYTSKVFSMKARLESIVANRKEQIADLLSKKLLLSTNNMMSDNFSKETCMNLVEYITNLKFRSKKVRTLWDSSTIFIWIVTIVVSLLSLNPFALLSCLVLAFITAFGVSYAGTKNLKFYEVIKISKTFSNISKFIDLNYDSIRSMLMIAGVFIIEFIMVAIS